MDKEKTMIALDCGNSSFRIVAGWYRDGKIHSEVVSQMPNNMVRIGEYYYWDLLRIFNEFKTVLKGFVSQKGKIDWYLYMGSGFCVF